MFKEIPGTNGAYSVDENGNVRANDREVFNNGSKRMCVIKGKPIKSYRNNKGYHYVDLMVDKKRNRQLVHRLVASTFIPNPDNLPVINHIDCNPDNNTVSNLEWCSIARNVQYGYELGHHPMTEKMRAARTAPKTWLWKPVTRVDPKTGEEKRYNSITAAAKDIAENISPDSPLQCIKTNISGAVRHSDRIKSSYGFVWKY